MARALGLDGGKWGHGDDIVTSTVLRRLGYPIRRGLVFVTLEMDPDDLAFDELAS